MNTYPFFQIRNVALDLAQVPILFDILNLVFQNTTRAAHSKRDSDTGEPHKPTANNRPVPGLLFLLFLNRRDVYFQFVNRSEQLPHEFLLRQIGTSTTEVAPTVLPSPPKSCRRM